MLQLQATIASFLLLIGIHPFVEQVSWLLHNQINYFTLLLFLFSCSNKINIFLIVCVVGKTNMRVDISFYFLNWTRRRLIEKVCVGHFEKPFCEREVTTTVFVVDLPYWPHWWHIKIPTDIEVFQQRFPLFSNKFAVEGKTISIVLRQVANIQIFHIYAAETILTRDEHC